MNEIDPLISKARQSIDAEKEARSAESRRIEEAEQKARLARPDSLDRLINAGKLRRKMKHENLAKLIPFARIVAATALGEIQPDISVLDRYKRIISHEKVLAVGWKILRHEGIEYGYMHPGNSYGTTDESDPQGRFSKYCMTSLVLGTNGSMYAYNTSDSWGERNEYNYKNYCKPVFTVSSAIEFSPEFEVSKSTSGIGTNKGKTTEIVSRGPWDGSVYHFDQLTSGNQYPLDYGNLTEPEAIEQGLIDFATKHQLRI